MHFARELCSCYFLMVTFAHVKAQNLSRQFSSSDERREVLNTTADYIKLYGYNVEHYNVASGDGFLISLFRIPGTGPPVIFHHGLLGASDTWVVQGPGNDLAYILADKGYDIWLADMRGNYYSRSHLRLSPSDPKFWDFSFHEVGIFDFPAIVDHILQVTGKQKVDIIGHSLGGATPFIMCSTRPEYNKKVRTIYALAPAVFLSNGLDSILVQALNKLWPLMKYCNQKLGIYEFFPRTVVLERMIKSLCGPDSKFYALCSLAYQSSFTTTQKLPVKLSEYATRVPRGTSYKNLIHAAQWANDKFARLDYGPQANLKLYGSKETPLYDLRRVTAASVIIYSDGDSIIPHQSVDRLTTVLPNIFSVHKIQKVRFNHGDFVWGSMATKHVNEVILDTIPYFDQQYPS